MIKELSKRITLRYSSWIIGSLAVAILACLTIVIFFRNSSYPIDQIAVVIAILFMVIVAFLRLNKLLSRGGGEQRKQEKEIKRLTNRNGYYIRLPLFYLYSFLAYALLLQFQFRQHSIYFLE